ncbi:DUF1152 domain-containing protein [Streptomyces sp. NPDC047976]|uniref:DUF1152 domain-containing protein n=1 Tax=Streptomyces sp. NPDC047976 TaxID=3155746 RepID=UPI00343670DD
MVHAALHGADTPALVLTYAWERLVVDPVPGPRRATDFHGTESAAPDFVLVTPGTRPVAPAGSLLPRLSGARRPRERLLGDRTRTPPPRCGGWVRPPAAHRRDGVSAGAARLLEWLFRTLPPRSRTPCRYCTACSATPPSAVSRSRSSSRSPGAATPSC